MQGNDRTRAQEVRQQSASDASKKQQWVKPSFERARLNDALDRGFMGPKDVDKTS